MSLQAWTVENALREMQPLQKGVCMMAMTKPEVLEIVDLYKQGWGYRNIARMTGKREKVVENVLIGKTFRSITGGRLCNGKRSKDKLAIYK
jgi:hypothetical protein